LDKFFKNRKNTLNDIYGNLGSDEKEKANNIDYIKGFIKLSKTILIKDEDTILSKKVNNLLNENKF